MSDSPSVASGEPAVAQMDRSQYGTNRTNDEDLDYIPPEKVWG